MPKLSAISTISATSSRLMLKCISFSLCIGLVACSGSNSNNSGSTTSSGSGGTTTPPAQPVTFAKATATLQKKIESEAPHFTNATPITAFNSHSFRSYLSKPWDLLLPSAHAADLGIDVIWDPENGSPPSGNDFAVLNAYIGGGFICASGSCTKGTTTVPQQESLKNYMGQALDPNFQNSNGASITVFGRLQATISTLCTIANVVPAASVDVDGLPVVGVLSLNLPTDTTSLVYQPVSAGGCGLSSADAGAPISATVTAVSSANYAKEMTLSGMSGALWVKLNPATGDFNIMSLEDQRPARYAVDRAIAQVSGASTAGAGKVLFEYVSIGSNAGGSTSCYAGGQWICSYEFHRIFIDEAANASYLVSNTGSPGDPSGGTAAPTYYVQYTAVGQPSALQACSSGGTCSGRLALSVSADGQQEPGSSTVYLSAGNDYNGCINLTDRSVAATNTLACDLTGTSVLAPGGASTMIESTRQVYARDVVATLLANTSASTTLAFSGASTIFTAPNTQ